MNRASIVLAAGASLCVAGGCVGGVEGKVDDESVPTLLSGFFIQLDEQDGVFGVNAAQLSMVNGCDAAAKRQDNLNSLTEAYQKDLKRASGAADLNKANEALADGQVQYDVDNLPSDYWTLSLSIGVARASALDRKTFDVAQGEASVTVCRINDYPAEKNHTLRPDADCFVGVKGKVTVDAFKKGASLNYVADVDLADGLDVNKDAGSAVITATTSYCAALEKSVDDYNQLLADAAGQ